MKIVCPCCQADFPIEAGINDVNAREAIKTAFSVAPFGDLLLGYVQLFKPEKRVLSMSRLVALLGELIPMIKDAKISHKSRTWPAPHAYWESAIRQMLDSREQLRLPLKNHSYLLTIISGYADKAEGKVEAQTEARKQGGISQRIREPPKTTGMPEEVRGQLNQFLNKSTGK